MKKYLLVTLLFFTGCASIKFVTTNHGQIVNDRGQVLNIVGNPPMTCFNYKHEVIAKGYFVYQRKNGAFLIDEFGKRYITVQNPICKLGMDE